MRSEDMPPTEEGEYYLHQLVGMSVVSDEGEKLGVLKEVLLTGANDVYLVESPEGEEILLPATEEVVLDINLEDGTMMVHIIPGLLD
jgi:16S rRNA processing protein RimM